MRGPLARLSPHGGAHAAAANPFSSDGPGPTLPVLQSGKERLDFVTLAIQPLAVMDWFLAAATGRDARRDALLDEHLTDFVPVIPSYPPSPQPQAAVLANTSAPVKSLHCPSRRWSRRGPPLLWQTPWSLLVMPPLLRLDAVGWALMSVASIISTSGSAESGGSGASRGIHPAQPLLNGMDDAAQHLPGIHPLPITLPWETRGGCGPPAPC